MMHQSINNLMSLLESSPESDSVFNPWYDVDPENDLSEESPKIRHRQLRQYLNERRRSAKYVLVGEALGYQGGHFSGMAMTSERILLNKLTHKGIRAEHVFTGIEPQRTSKPVVKADGFTEPTATIAWGTMLDLGIDPYDFVIWNTFAWHPWNPKKGRLSNRRPTDQELSFGFGALATFMQVFDGCTVIAVGKIAGANLVGIVDKIHDVRHPANGGAGQFREQVAALIKG